MTRRHPSRLTSALRVRAASVGLDAGGRKDSCALGSAAIGQTYQGPSSQDGSIVLMRVTLDVT
ncbi:hypothetical protein O4220_24035 [Rhodococcus ruber]|uniref:Uncharacterized protein n=1 Tax=Rhodococcus ruber TaxID=1830 RepID=A0ABT4MKV7_9NOCA|nr:hypothetical protein [Rhodococcus ruber]MCZ4521601.1 hypothetical protein [Rhodococcus ruber]